MDWFRPVHFFFVKYLREIMGKRKSTYIHFNELCPTLEDKKNFLKDLLEKNPTSYQKILSGKNYVEVNQWLYDSTPKLQDQIYSNSTRIYWILNDLTDFPKCLNQNCNNKIGIGKNIKTSTGYQLYCSRSCSANSNLVKEHLKEASLKKYGVDNPFKAKEIIDKIKNTNLQKYGVTSYTQTKEYFNKITEKLEEINKKRNNTHHQNNSFHISTQEEQLKIWFQLAFPNIKFQYSSSNYPFNCDFYIPEKDLYIEFMGTWTHGKHPFNQMDNNDIQLLNYWKNKNTKYYENAIYTWTKLDVSKREIAKQNKLNYLELWSMNEAMQWIKDNSTNLNFSFEDTLKFKFKHSIVNLKEFQIIPEYEIKSYFENIFVPSDFPYPKITDSQIQNEIERLRSTKLFSDKLSSPIIRKHCPSIWSCESHGTKSPIETWNDLKSNVDLFSKLYSNRMKYIGKVNLNILREGLAITRISNKATYFKPTLAKRLIKTYLNDATEIFNPFNGFSGIMLGATLGCDKKYIGQDLNKTFVKEANDIISNFNLKNASVIQKDIFDSQGIYECLFCCPPYEDLERWNFDDYGNICLDKNLSCDEWIDVVLSRFKCGRYLFIVDSTIKYKDFIVETLTNSSHLEQNDEIVVLI